MSANIVEVEGPDGNVYEFPAGTTEDQALAYFRKTTPLSPQVSTGESVKKGLLDPIEAGAQLLEKSVPESVRRGVNTFNNWLADKTGLVAKVGEKGLAEDIAQRERDYQERRAAAGQTGVDWGRVGGNVVSPANLAIGAAAAPLNLAGRLVAGGAQGLLSQPVESTDNFAEQKARQAALGVAGAGVGEVAGRTLGRIISPAASRDPAVQSLMEEGVTPTMGHLLGSKATAVERALHVTPILGTAIAGAESRTFEDFNRAVANRILRNVGEKVSKDVPVGTELFAKTNQILSDKYESLLPKLKGAIDQPLQQDLNTIRSMAQSLPKSSEETLNRILKTDLEDRFTQAGLANGHTVKEVESIIGKKARDYRISSDPDQRQIGNALTEVQRSLREMVMRQNPTHAPELQKINESWALLIRMEKAASSTGAQRRGGVFTPEDYLGAIKSADSSLRKRNVAKGTALDQDFAQAAQRVLGKEPQSLGQAYRIAAGLGLAGPYLQNPKLLLGEGLASLPYTPVGQKIVATALGRRPTGAAGVRDFIKSNTPLTYAATGSPLQQMRDINPEQIYRPTWSEE